MNLLLKIHFFSGMDIVCPKKKKKKNEEFELKIEYILDNLYSLFQFLTILFLKLFSKIFHYIMPLQGLLCMHSYRLLCA